MRRSSLFYVEVLRMKNRNKRILTALLAVGAAGGFLGASQGSQTDPLVTMSYINQVTTPKILSEVDVKLGLREQALVDRLNAAIAQYEKDMEQKFKRVVETTVVMFHLYCLTYIYQSKIYF